MVFEERRDFVIFLIIVVFEDFGLFAFESEASEFPFDVLEDGGGGAGGLFGHLLLRSKIMGCLIF